VLPTLTKIFLPARTKISSAEKNSDKGGDPQKAGIKTWTCSNKQLTSLIIYYYLKGLSHEIDFTNLDQNLQNLALLRDAAGLTYTLLMFQICFPTFKLRLIVRKGIPSCVLFRGMVWNGSPRICISFGSTERKFKLCSLL
jgi:hypothetical protein